MAKINQKDVDSALATLEAAPDGLLASRAERLVALAAKVRPQVQDTLAGGGDAVVTPKSPEALALARYKKEYDCLPSGAKGRLRWRAVTKKLLANEGAKLKKADAMQGGGHLFHITKRREVLFKDKGVEPVMYGWDKPKDAKDRQLVQIYGCDSELMAKIEQWANAPEIEGRVTVDDYELFEDNGNFGFSEEMERAAAANEGGLFIASQDKTQWRDTVLKNGRVARFDPDFGYVRVDDFHPGHRSGYRGAVRLLRV